MELIQRLGLVGTGIALAFLFVLGCGNSRHCAAGAACSPDNPCHGGTLTCDGDTPACSDNRTNLADGTLCGLGATCRSGVCGDGGVNDGGCPGAIADCGPNRYEICVDNDPDNCGQCGLACPTGRCRHGACFECRAGSPEDCPAGELCVDGSCGKPCSFALDGGSEASCDGGFCRPFASTDPPAVNVGICTPGGTHSDPGLGAACAGPCSDALDCFPDTSSSSGSFCSSLCDPTRAGSCPVGWGCDATFEANQQYAGYGVCQQIESSQAGAGAPCSATILCQPGTACLPAMVTGGPETCAAWCDPLASDTCGSNTCAVAVTTHDYSARIGNCLANVPNARTLGQNCSLAALCENSLYCAPVPGGTTICQAKCNPWAATCAVGSGCLPLLDGYDHYFGFGVCSFPAPNALPEFAQCDLSAQNCGAGLVCLGFGAGGICIQYCDPFNPATCPPAQWCVSLPDALGRFSEIGFCDGEKGKTHAGDTCNTYSDCLSGDCYFSERTASSGTCIQACALGSAFGCTGGNCVDAGFGGGLGQCVLSDGGSWD